jgi:hypothetical protein
LWRSHLMVIPFPVPSYMWEPLAWAPVHHGPSDGGFDSSDDEDEHFGEGVFSDTAVRRKIINQVREPRCCLAVGQWPCVRVCLRV